MLLVSVIVIVVLYWWFLPLRDGNGQITFKHFLRLLFFVRPRALKVLPSDLKSLPKPETRLPNVNLQPFLKSYAKCLGLSHSAPVPLAIEAFLFPSLLECMSRLPVPFFGSVHKANETRQRRRIDPSERLDATVGVSEYRRVHHGLQVSVQMTLVNRALDEDSEPCWQSTVTLLCFMRHLPGERPEKPARPQLDIDSYEDDCALRLRRDLGWQFAKLTLDWNPIHMWDWASKLLGFKGQLAQGMAVQGIYCANSLQQRFAVPLQHHVKFVSPVYFFEGRVDFKRQADGHFLCYQGDRLCQIGRIAQGAE